jgi:hypothetical protein
MSDTSHHADEDADDGWGLSETAREQIALLDDLDEGTPSE